MKNIRHSKILELIANEFISTQEGLLEKLKSSGFDVTQATVSRDIRELGIHKVRSETGKYHYVSVLLNQGGSVPGKFATIFTESVKTIQFANNIVVIKCYTGMANAACATFDAAELENVVGTLSGDDTFIAIMKDNHSAEETTQKLKNLLIR